MPTELKFLPHQAHHDENSFYTIDQFLLACFYSELQLVQ